MRQQMPLDRRRFLLAAASAALPAGADAAAPESLHLLVASPPGARLDRWADPLSTAVGRGLPSHLPLLRQNVGGLDGITGANTFEARAEPDGSTALLVPGASALSWLVGETRAKFDPAHWLLLWAAALPGVLVSRVQLQPGRNLNIAAAGPTGPELPILLALDLFGVSPVLTPAADADAVFLQGSPQAISVQSAAARGLNPVLSLGAIGADGTPGRDPMLPTIPTTLELARERTPPLLASALQAATLAVQLDAGLVLPQLTPAASVATWRRACQPALSNPELVAEAARLGAQMLPAPTATTCVGRIAGDPDVLLALRRWLATRYDWRPA